MCYNFTHRGTVGGGDAPSIDNAGEYIVSNLIEQQRQLTLR